jgi:hypothetical protein
VDDIIAVIPSVCVDDFLLYINSINPSIQFTSELEKNGCLAYLDLLIRRNPNGQLDFTIYKKPTSSDKYLNYHSNHPVNQKRSVANTLFHRVDTLCSDDVKEEENRLVINSLANNGYPARFIRASQHRRNLVADPIESQDVRYVSAPYIKGTSERVNRMLKRHAINLAHKPANTLRKQLCHMKDKQTAGDISDSTYRINCNDCDHSYVGETGRNTRTRIEEHRSNVVKRDPTSLVYQHVRRTGHTMNFDSFQVLDINDHVKNRRFIESCFTNSQSNAINRCITLPEIYKPLARQLCSGRHPYLEN